VFGRTGVAGGKEPEAEAELVSVRREEKSPVRRRGQVEVVPVQRMKLAKVPGLRRRAYATWSPGISGGGSLAGFGVGSVTGCGGS
jgi:hypothetical protein